MDSINIFNLKFEKSNAFAKYLRVEKIATLFRVVELFVFLVIIPRVFVQFTFSVQFSGDYFHRISSTLFNSWCVFLIGNAIVITLFLKSGRLSEKYISTGNKSTSDFCAEYVEKSVGEYPRREDIVVFDTDQNSTARKIYRSQSENLHRGGEKQSINRGGEKQSINRGGEKQSRQLRRSATENLREIPPAVSSYMAEEMSGDEFRQTVEAFIARQQKFLREEEFQTIVMEQEPVFDFHPGGELEDDVVDIEELELEGNPNPAVTTLADVVNVEDDTCKRALAEMVIIDELPFRMETFKKCVEKEKIKSKQTACLDVCTRWNSTYLMLEVTIKFEKAFQRMGEEDNNFIKFFGIKEGDEDLSLEGEGDEGGSHMVPTPRQATVPNKLDWKKCGLFATFLKLFYDATKKFSASLFVTSNVFFHDLFEVETRINESILNRDPFMSKMAIEMKRKFETYWGDVEKFNPLLYVAVALDPEGEVRQNVPSASSMPRVTEENEDCDRRLNLASEFDTYLEEEYSSVCSSEVDKYLGDLCERRDNPDFDILVLSEGLWTLDLGLDWTDDALDGFVRLESLDMGLAA
ncbi:hypothetical protein RHSIM_Rhsim05G0072700 [Rhododendron simsii]|uniref:hAT-like transposase RNase-H fold domain-containing protein n=1 Tax=Rhododendron simsii TaxID=118357 RepID=A0A834GWY8_RHOSS|nr:hypothetical protein RHSIM_Rhsim05G0072700 [Rhododendron simsii]